MSAASNGFPYGDIICREVKRMMKSPNWSEWVAQSKLFKFGILSTVILFIAIIALILFMIGSFLFKLYILDYRFDDGEIQPPIESIQGQH